MASYARHLTRPQRRALPCWFHPKTHEEEVPSESCFLRVLQGVAPLEVEFLTLAGQDQVLGPNTDPLVAIDGKTLKHSGVPWADQRQPRHPAPDRRPPPAGEPSPLQVVRIEANRSRRERRALATRAIEPAQLGLAGAAQLGCLPRQSGQEAQPEVEY